MNLIWKKICLLAAVYYCCFGLILKTMGCPTSREIRKRSVEEEQLSRVSRSVEMFQLNCGTCTAAVGTLNFIFRFATHFEAVKPTVKIVCVKFKIAAPSVCSGIIDAFGDEAFYVLKNTVLTSKQVCSAILGQKCGPDSNTWDTWTIPIPPKPNKPVRPIVQPSPGSPVLKVLHLTDLHLDLQYSPGSNSQCMSPICCRNNSVPDYGDVPLHAGQWGDYGKCDTPLQTYKLMLHHIAETHQIDYIIFTGDIPPHDIWAQVPSTQIQNMRKAFSLLSKFFPNTPVYPCVGNHEAYPVDSFAPPTIPLSVSSPKWLFVELNRTWSQWLPPETSTTILRGGYYSVLVHPGFRIIAINNNYCDNKNMWLMVNSTDPTGQLQWLVRELQSAEELNEKVHIVGHIPPGSSDCLKAFSHAFYSIINRFEKIVVAMFYGHTHTDEFEVFYDLEGVPRRPNNIAYVAPSVTPFVGFNPAYRIYHVDGNYTNSSRVVLDHETHYLNLTKANSSPSPYWEKLYSAKDAYGMSSLLPTDWDELIDKMKTNDTMFHLYYHFFTRGSPVAPVCDQDMKDLLLCNLQSGRSNDPSLCRL